MEMNPRDRLQTKRAKWDEEKARRVLGELQASGQSVKVYARQRGLDPQRLRWWQRRLGSSSPSATPIEEIPRFLPVTLRPTEAEVPVAALVSVGAVRVELRTLDATSASWVAQVARAWEGET